jgi:hypothetical protein
VTLASRNTNQGNNYLLLGAVAGMTTLSAGDALRMSSNSESMNG